MSPVSGKTDPSAEIYVLDRYIAGRPFREKIHRNAERADTDRFYADGVYNWYPVEKAALEKRRATERRKDDRNHAWARAALAAADAKEPIPPNTNELMTVVLGLLYDAGKNGMTRKEISRLLDLDGGKVSAVLSDLHAVGIIFPLEGVKR